MNNEENKNVLENNSENIGNTVDNQGVTDSSNSANIGYTPNTNNPVNQAQPQGSYYYQPQNQQPNQGMAPQQGYQNAYTNQQGDYYQQMPQYNGSNDNTKVAVIVICIVLALVISCVCVVAFFVIPQTKMAIETAVENNNIFENDNSLYEYGNDFDEDCYDNDYNDAYDDNGINYTNGQSYVIFSSVEGQSTLEYLTNFLQENPNITDVTMSCENIEDFSDLKGYTQIESLSISDIPENQLYLLGSLYKLNYLSISNYYLDNPIQNLDFANNLSGLNYLELYCFDDSYNNEQPQTGNLLDISALQGLSKLRSVNLYGYSVKSLEPFKNNTELKSLMVSNVSDGDLSYIKGLKDLGELRVRSKEIKNINTLADLNQIYSLDISTDKGITNLDFTKNMEALMSLDVYGYTKSNNNIGLTDISAIKDKVQLHSLTLSCEGIKDMSAINNLTNISDLNLYGANINNLSFLSNFKLSSLTLTLSNSGKDSFDGDISALASQTFLSSLTFGNIDNIKDFSPLYNVNELKYIYTYDVAMTDLQKSELADHNKIILDM